MPVFAFQTRSESEDGVPASALSLKSPNGPIYIAGIAVGGAILLSLVLWLTIRACRKRSRTKREEARNGAFLSVRGVVREGEEKQDELSADHIAGLTLRGDIFSRHNMTHDVVLPEKAALRQNATREEIFTYHSDTGTLPKPFSFALEAGSPSPRSSRMLPTPDGLFGRQSFMSEGSRFSVVSTASSVDSTGGSTRRIRQLFEPVLPDELLISSLGERLTVIQSFDDGWTLVGRENSMLASFQKSLFKAPSQSADSNVELGVIPAWCFVKPCKGLRVERPVRTSSLGITVKMEDPVYSSRDDVISWSNF